LSRLLQGYAGDILIKKQLGWLMFVSAAVLAACSAVQIPGLAPTDEPPGVGEKAERGYAASEPIIAALEKFREDNGQYPDLIAYLVPDYLPVLWTGGDDLDYSYSLTDEGYSFSFHYRGPGMNTCRYRPAEGWHCSGAF
jgi:hypothetical protein